jgi:hypothetical protein
MKKCIKRFLTPIVQEILLEMLDDSNEGIFQSQKNLLQSILDHKQSLPKVSTTKDDDNEEENTAPIDFLDYID